MKKFLIILVLAAVVGFVYWNSQNSSKPEPQERKNTALYENGEIGYSFEYTKAPQGYVLETVPSLQGYPSLVEGLILMAEEDYQSIARGEREGGEGPPTINIFVFRNTGNLSLQGWLEANPQITNLNLAMGGTLSTELGGVDALAYAADGLYASRNIAAIKNGYVFLLSGFYLDQDSEIYRDFSGLVQSFKFLK